MIFLEMSTDLKSDAVNFSKKEKSPEPAPVVSLKLFGFQILKQFSEENDATENANKSIGYKSTSEISNATCCQVTDKLISKIAIEFTCAC